jgi:hypothetical protein
LTTVSPLFQAENFCAIDLGALLEQGAAMASNNTNTHRRFILQGIFTGLVALVLIIAPVPVLAQSAPAESENSSETALPDYKGFIETVRTGEKGILRGVYVPGVMALPIVQQPYGYPGYVSSNNNEITQFRMAAEAGNIGLLAHNYLSGTIFTNLTVGQEVRLIYGDGTVEYFVIEQVLQYQALQPYSPNSDFRDLETDITISAEQLFRKVYRGERHVTFQTCIEAYGNSSWGRLFIVAQPKLFPYIEQQYIFDNVLPNIY